MATIKELIKAEETGGLSFGNYELKEKTKQSGFLYEGNSYKVKTFCEITKLEKDEVFAYESVPGTTVHRMVTGDGTLDFSVEGNGNTQITVGMEPDCEYKVILDGEMSGYLNANLGGKLSFSVDLTPEKTVKVQIEKC